MRPVTAKQILKRILALALLGIVLLACLAPSEYLLLPRAFEPPGRTAYRVAYLVTLPFRMVVASLIPQENHHWSVAHTTVLALGAPFFFWALFRAAHAAAGLLTRIVARPVARRESNAADGCAVSQLPAHVGRREFLALAGTGCAAASLCGYAAFVEPARLCVRYYEVLIRNLTQEFNGLRIVHISDTHYGPFVSLRYLERIIARANSLSPDLVALTGDYVHRSIKAIEPGIEVFSGLRSRYGTVAVLGNHEHWEDATASREALRRIGARLLDNDRVFVSSGGLSGTESRSDTLCLAGVGDLWEDAVSFDRALGGVEGSIPRIVLSHNPDAAEMVGPRHRVDLMLAGHTHGGQIWLPGYGPLTHASQYGNKYIGGLCHGPYCPVIVSRGAGLAGVPLRFAVPPEIGVVTLRPLSHD